MEISNFFIFSRKLASSTIQAHPVESEIDHLNLVKGNYAGIHFPIVFKQEYGDKLDDILGTGYAGFFLISDRMRDVLKKNNLTGWKTFPIKLYDRKENEIPGYHGFSVIGRCGPINYEKSEIIEKKLVPTGPICKYYKGISIDKLDGTDFFSPDKTYQTFITEKAVDALKKNKISNMRFENLAEYEIDIRHVRKGS